MIVSMFFYAVLVALVSSEMTVCSQTVTEPQSSSLPIVSQVPSMTLLERRQNPSPYSSVGDNLRTSIIVRDESYFNAFVAKATTEELQHKSSTGETYAYAAVSHRRPEMFQELMKRPVDVDAQNHNGDTIAHCAVVCGDVPALEALQEQHADFERENSEGLTACALAVQLDRQDELDVLLRSRVSVRQKNMYGNEPLHSAKSASSVTNLMEAGADSNAIGFCGTTPIASAVKNNRSDVIEPLLDYGALVHYVDELGNNLLHLTRSGSVAQILIGAGVDIHARNVIGETPLHCAARLRDPFVAIFLMTAGAHLTDMNDKKQTPLHCVNFLAVAQALVEHGAVVHDVDNKRHNALHSVIARSKVNNLKKYDLLWADAGEFFLNCGCNMYQRDLDGKDAMVLSFEANNSDMVSLLMQRGFDVRRPYFTAGTARIGFHKDVGVSATYLHAAARFSCVYGVRTMVAAGLLIGAQNEYGENALHLAARFNRDENLRVLIESYRGLDKEALLNLPTKNGYTLLHYAVGTFNEHAVKLLLSYPVSASIIHRDYLGKTSFDYVRDLSLIKDEDQEKAEAVRKLLLPHQPVVSRQVQGLLLSSQSVVGRVVQDIPSLLASVDSFSEGKPPLGRCSEKSKKKSDLSEPLLRVESSSEQNPSFLGGIIDSCFKRKKT